MITLRSAAALAVLAIVVGTTASAQAQSMWDGWRGSSVNSPNRDFAYAGAPVSGSNAYASCYRARVHYLTKKGTVVSRRQLICPQ